MYVLLKMGIFQPAIFSVPEGKGFIIHLFVQQFFFGGLGVWGFILRDAVGFHEKQHPFLVFRCFFGDLLGMKNYPVKPGLISISQENQDSNYFTTSISMESIRPWFFFVAQLDSLTAWFLLSHTWDCWWILPTSWIVGFPSWSHYFHQRFQVPKMEVSITYKSYTDTSYVRENPPPKWLYTVQYLHLRFLKFLVMFVTGFIHPRWSTGYLPSRGLSSTSCLCRHISFGKNAEEVIWSIPLISIHCILECHICHPTKKYKENFGSN